MAQNILIIGFGTVGQGLCSILNKKKQYLAEKYDFSPRVVGIADLKYGTVFHENGLDTKTLINEIREHGAFTSHISNQKTMELIKNPAIDTVCELSYTNLETGLPAVDFCKTALEYCKHVATTNKGPAAIIYHELKEIADLNKVQFRIEGTVMSGTPVLNLIEGPLAGCSFSKMEGILNGTTNFILSQMENGLSFDKAMKKAQELGYAEADPSGDVDGYDARAKVTILANIMMDAKIPLKKVTVEGIRNISAAEIDKAKEKDMRWKLLGCIVRKGNDVEAFVKPVMLPSEHPLYHVSGAVNALTITTDLLGKVTITGSGAGKTETGYAVLNDLIAIHRNS